MFDARMLSVFFFQNLKPLIVVNYSGDPLSIGRPVSNGGIFLLVSSFVSLGDFRKTRTGILELYETDVSTCSA